MIKPELLAPVGSMDGLKGVINAGADAVYLAGKMFGARAYANNFDTDELISAIELCHLFGVKVYLTVNTLVKNSEIGKLIPFLSPLYDIHLDGVIVQDFGVIKTIHDAFPLLDIHLSTQQSVTVGYSANSLKKYNVTRIVPARELSFDEIIELKNFTGMEIECFIHGAMCYSYSGMCLFSSLIGGRSGNRGRCAQPCRLPYKAFGDNEKYPLSMRDMCSLPILKELIGAGIDSFKIEGRMKDKAYAAGVTAIYRKYIDGFCDGTITTIDNKDMEFLKGLYIRKSVSNGYYHIHNGKEMITIDSPSYNGSSETVIDYITNEYLSKEPRIGINMVASFLTGEEMELQCSYDLNTIRLKGPVVLKANNQPITKQNLSEHLTKTGDTSFVIDNLDITMSDDGFLPVKAIKELRREALSKLKELIIGL